MPGPDDEKRAGDALMRDPNVQKALDAMGPVRPFPLGPSPDFYCTTCDVFDIEPHEHANAATLEAEED